MKCMLIRVEVAPNPSHGDDEGEDGEANYEEEFIAHDCRVDTCKREMVWGRGKYLHCSSVVCTVYETLARQVLAFAPPRRGAGIITRETRLCISPSSRATFSSKSNVMLFSSNSPDTS